MDQNDTVERTRSSKYWGGFDMALSIGTATCARLFGCETCCLYKTKTKNKPITQVKLRVQTLASRDLVPGPGSHQAWDLFVGIEILMLVSLLLPSGGRPGKKCVTLACRICVCFGRVFVWLSVDVAMFAICRCRCLVLLLVSGVAFVFFIGACWMKYVVIVA